MEIFSKVFIICTSKYKDLAENIHFFITKSEGKKITPSGILGLTFFKSGHLTILISSNSLIGCFRLSCLAFERQHKQHVHSLVLCFNLVAHCPSICIKQPQKILQKKWTQKKHYIHILLTSLGSSLLYNNNTDRIAD